MGELQEISEPIGGQSQETCGSVARLRLSRGRVVGFLRLTRGGLADFLRLAHFFNYFFVFLMNNYY